VVLKKEVLSVLFLSGSAMVSAQLPDYEIVDEQAPFSINYHR
jgi:hypothetical protein